MSYIQNNITNNPWHKAAEFLKNKKRLIENYFHIYGTIELNDEYSIIKSDDILYVSGNGIEVVLVSVLAQIYCMDKNSLKNLYKGHVEALENWLNEHDYYEYAIGHYYN